MRAGIPREPEGETRVAMVPNVVPKLAKLGFEVVVEKGQADQLRDNGGRCRPCTSKARGHAGGRPELPQALITTRPVRAVAWTNGEYSA